VRTEPSVIAPADGVQVLAESDPPALERQEPASETPGVEPSAPIVFYFNRPIELGLLGVEVLETAHGKVYASQEPGADLTQLSRVEPVKERDLVMGKRAGLPTVLMCAPVVSIRAIIDSAVRSPGRRWPGTLFVREVIGRGPEAAVRKSRRFRRTALDLPVSPPNPTPPDIHNRPPGRPRKSKFPSVRRGRP